MQSRAETAVRAPSLPVLLVLCASALLPAPALAQATAVQAQASPRVDDGPALRGSMAGDGLITSSIAAPVPSTLRMDGAVFNSVPFPASQLTISPRWQEIMADNPARIFSGGCERAPATCQTAIVKAYARLDAENEASPQSRLVLARKVNLAVNHGLRYQLDSVTYGQEDYWATPAESAARGAGDCEDFAILKMGMLAALGLPLTSMQVVVVKDVKRNMGHAVLNVRLGQTNYILDNLTDVVRSDDLITTYQPFYSVAANGAWLHGVRRPVAMKDLDGGQQILKTDIMSLDPAAQIRGTLGRFDPSRGR